MNFSKIFGIDLRHCLLPFDGCLINMKKKKARQFIEVLTRKRNIHAYPILVEGHGKVVSQAEHTLIPSDSFINIITL